MSETKGKNYYKNQTKKTPFFRAKRKTAFLSFNTLIIIYLYIKHIKVCESESERHIKVLRNGKLFSKFSQKIKIMRKKVEKRV